MLTGESIFHPRAFCYRGRVATRTALMTDARMLAHEPGPGHPERPDRLRVLLELTAGVTALERVAAREATDAEIERVHAPRLLEAVEASRGRRATRFDADTATSAGSCEAARLAAGGLVDLALGVLAGHADNGLALVRPPGHHAERDRVMGFCLFNNVAVAAAALRAAGAARVAIVDWDLHHGNGTQHIFEADPTVLYVSTHQYPYYPGTGAADEIGVGAGAGYTLNVPCPAGFGDGEFRVLFDEVVIPRLRAFAPDVVLVSAGFDCDGRDPLGGLVVTPAGIFHMARAVADVAREVAGGRLVVVLEGGYDLGALVDGTGIVLDELRGRAAPVPPPVTGDGRRAAPVAARVNDVHHARGLG
jgi:acetoin utilization deacetylase AcuC-like enzyme